MKSASKEITMLRANEPLSKVNRCWWIFIRLFHHGFPIKTELVSTFPMLLGRMTISITLKLYPMAQLLAVTSVFRPTSSLSRRSNVCLNMSANYLIVPTLLTRRFLVLYFITELKMLPHSQSWPTSVHVSHHRVSVAQW